MGYALYRGVKNGLLLELGSIVALLAGVWLAFNFGERVGLWLGFDNATASVGGFILLLVAVVLFIVLACRILREVVRLAGLGLFDIVGGAVVSVGKTAVVLSLLLGFAVPFNAKNEWIDPAKFEQSKSVEHIRPLAEKVFPYLNEAKELYMETLTSPSSELWQKQEQ